jgi:hypothetical protein
VAGHFLDRGPGVRRVRPQWREGPPAWLTPYARDLLTNADGLLPSAVPPRRPEQNERVLGASGALGASGSIPMASRAGAELRHPYRDRRLVQFMLAVLAHQLYNHCRWKHVLRNARQSILPEVIGSRPLPTSLLPLSSRGLVEREAVTVRALLDAPDALWLLFGSREQLASAFLSRFGRGSTGLRRRYPGRALGSSC